MPHTEIELFHYWRSSCSWRVRWALALKGVAYKSTPINLLKKEQNDLSYLKINPSGQV
ncbi:MAG: maleylacetoacetate isomerase, partial [Proteobacteria bacterium]